MTDTHTATEVVAEFIAQEAGIEVREAMPQAHEFVEFLNSNGFAIIERGALAQGPLAEIVASRRGATARVNDIDKLMADRIRTHLIGEAL